VGGLHRAVKEGADAVLMQSPTGSGKTSTIAEGVILPSLAQGRRFVFAAHLEELLDDTAARLRSMGVPCGIVKAGRPSDPSAPVQVCSTQTLAPMLARGEQVPPAHRFILDEAHRSSSATNRAVIAHYKGTGAKILGLSATPCRGDEQPLDEFQALVTGPSVRELIDGGFLVEPIVHAPAKVLERGVAEDPAELVNSRCQGRRAVIFAATAAHALDIARRIPGAETVLDSTPFDVRSTVRDRLASGETQHLVTVKALLEGFDAPLLDVVVLCGAFTTVTPYLQAIGRGLRAYTCPITGRVRSTATSTTSAAPCTSTGCRTMRAGGRWRGRRGGRWSSDRSHSVAVRPVTTSSRRARSAPPAAPSITRRCRCSASSAPPSSPRRASPSARGCSSGSTAPCAPSPPSAPTSAPRGPAPPS
ncbi:MAG: DEAD/DEAH box helicase family protein, partial [Myxococcales bacterium]|nr:DEAD/DEAH box helicase family protein [Myxococcales bacterium]